MKILSNFLILAATAIIASCSGSDRGNRDAEAEKVIDSINDTTERAQAITADVDLNGDEKTFVLTAAAGGMTEVEAANIVLQLSKNEEIKAFARMMQKDHGKANRSLDSIAKGKGITLPATLPDDKQAQLATLKSMNGKKFEEQYVTMMIADHASTIKLFTAGTTLPNGPLKMFAQQNLPVITHHYNEAVKLGKKMNLKHAGTGDDLPGESPAPGETH